MDWLSVPEGGHRGAVQDVQKGPSDPEQVGETVEAEIDQVAGQLHNLGRAECR